VYALLDASAPTSLALPALAAGSALIAGSMIVAGRRTPRTRYRPDPWRLPEWVTSLSGLTAAAGLFVVAAVQPDAVQPSLSPLVVPPFPPLAAAAVLLALLPAFATPAPPALTTPDRSDPAGAGRVGVDGGADDQPNGPSASPTSTRAAPEHAGTTSASDGVTTAAKTDTAKTDTASTATASTATAATATPATPAGGTASTAGSTASWGAPA
jgi:hypothetical protein